jgi:hypothetical protein
VLARRVTDRRALSAVPESGNAANAWTLLQVFPALAVGADVSRDSPVGIATGCTAWVRFPAGAGIFLFSTVSRPALGPTQHPIQPVLGAHSPG